MYEFCYDYVKPKYGEKTKLCCMDRESFLIYIRIDDIYKDIAKDVETKLDTANYEKIKKVTEVIKVKSGGKIIIKLV